MVCRNKIIHLITAMEQKVAVYLILVKRFILTQIYFVKAKTDFMLTDSDTGVSNMLSVSHLY